MQTIVTFWVLCFVSKMHGAVEVKKSKEQETAERNHYALTPASSTTCCLTEGIERELNITHDENEELRLEREENRYWTETEPGEGRRKMFL